MYIDLLGPQMVVRSPWHGSTSSSRLSADYHRERVQQPNYHACAGAAAAQILEPAPELMDMVDRERAAAALEEQLRPQRQAQKREAEAPRPGGNRNEGLEWSADGSARWKTRPERPEPGELARLAGLCWAHRGPRDWLAPLPAAQLRLAVGMLLANQPGRAALLRDVDVADSVGRLLRARVPLRFSNARHNVELSEGGAVARGGPYCYGSALCAAAPPMVDGQHFAEFVLKGESSECMPGIADAAYDPSGAEPFATTGEAGFGFNCWSGKWAHGGRERPPLWGSGLPSPARGQGLGRGQTVGLLLDLRGKEGSLTLWVDGVRLGVLCEGIPLRCGGWRWLVELRSTGAAVAVRERPPPAED